MRRITVCLLLALIVASAGYSATTSEYWMNRLEFRDTETYERVLPVAPLLFVDDFLGYQLLTSESGSTGVWEDVDVGNATEGVATDEANGAAQIALTDTDEAQDAVLYWGDQKGIDLNHDAIVEMRVNFSTLPSGTATAVFGMCGDHNLAKDSVTEAAWFRIEGSGSGAILVETDDTTNNNDDKATSVTAATTTYNYFRIDFTDLSDVRFYIDGVHVGTSTTFDMSNLTSTEAIMQPYFSLDKAGGAGVGTMKIDYIRIWSNRD